MNVLEQMEINQSVFKINPVNILTKQKNVSQLIVQHLMAMKLHNANLIQTLMVRVSPFVLLKQIVLDVLKVTQLHCH